ncbi:MAG: hypothetical protein NVSMB38_37180 [Ktedonobacteraceae bacterium]
MTCMKSNRTFLRNAEAKNMWDRLSLFRSVRQEVKEMLKGYYADCKI